MNAGGGGGALVVPEPHDSAGDSFAFSAQSLRLRASPLRNWEVFEIRFEYH